MAYKDKEKEREHKREYHAKNREHALACFRLRTYGPEAITHYENQSLAQKGLCAICGREQVRRRLCQDHNHVTSQLRGLLCDKCNLGLHYVELGGRAWLKNVVKYLDEWEGDTWDSNN